MFADWHCIRTIVFLNIKQNYQGWEFAHRFSERIARFLPKNEQVAQKNERFAHLLIFSEQPERFAHGHSFLVSDLSDSHMVAHFW